MNDNKKTSKSNNTPVVLALIILPVLFIFGAMIIIAMVMTTNKPNVKLTLSEPNNITDRSANFSVNIEGDKDKIQSKGFVYGTASNPELKSRTNNSNPFYDLFNDYRYSELTGTYVEMSEDKNNAIADDLLPETKYYVRAYAITGAGITYSNELSFMTKEKFEPNSINKNTTSPQNTSDEFKNIISNTPSDYNPNNPDSRNRKRLGDINSILTAVLQLKKIDPNAEIFKKNDAYPRNIRFNGSGRCIYSSVSLEDSTLQVSLQKFGYSIPTDPVAKTEGCSDYTIKIWDYPRDGKIRNIIEIEAYNVDKGEIIRVDSTGSE